MFKGIFHKRGAASQGTESAPGAEATQLADAGVDRSIVAISRELSGLTQIPVPQAAKERGWASLQRELERRPVRAAGSAVAGAGRAARPAHSRGWRWALGSAAAAVAVVAGLLGAYGGGVFQTVATDDHPTTVTSVVSSDTTQPDTTVSTEPSTTVTSDVTTDTNPPTTTQGTIPDTSTTGSSTTQPTSSTNTTRATSTTQPTSPPATGPQNAATQRERNAITAASALVGLVINGNASGAQALVAPEARNSLVRMKESLNDPDPYYHSFPVVESSSGDTLVVTVDIKDRVDNGQGQLVVVVKTFAIEVRVNRAGAIVIGIGGR